jgi:hypothetical protein
VEQQLDPRLRGKPVAVIPVETDSSREEKRHDDNASEYF